MAQYTEAIQKLYVAYFNRPADAGGLNFWESSVAAQAGSTAQVSALFASSKEYKDAYAGMSNAAIVDQIYVNLFGRHAEAGGLQFWAKHLDAGNLTMDNVVTEVSRGAQGSDLVAFNAKVAAATSFTDTLGKSANLAAQYSSANAIRAARDYLTNVTDTVSLNHTKANVDALLEGLWHVNTGNNLQYILTASKDVLYGGSGADTISGTEFEATSVLNSGDVFNGGLGVDTLSLSVARDTAYTLPETISMFNIENVNISSGTALSANTSSWLGLQKLTATTVGNANIKMGNANLSLEAKSVLDNSVTVNGGKNIDILVTDLGSKGKISVGESQAATGEVSVKNLSFTDGAFNSLNVVGGSKIVVQQFDEGPIAVTGSALTSNVSVTTGNVINAPLQLCKVPVTITDVASVAGQSAASGTLTDISVTGHAAVVINDMALKSLKVASNDGTVTINSSAITAPSNRVLDVEMSDFYGLFDDKSGYAEINFHLRHSTYLFGVSASAATKLTVENEGSLTINSITAPKLEYLKGSTINLFSETLQAMKNLHTIDFSGSTDAHDFVLNAEVLNYSGGTVDDKLNMRISANASPVKKVFALGEGNNELFGGADHFTVTAGSGNDAVTLTNGNNQVSLGQGNNEFTAGDGKNTYSGGSGNDVVTLGGGMNAVSVGTGNDRVIFTKASATVNSYSTISDPHSGMTIALPQLGDEGFNPNKIVLSSSSTFQDYANAAIAQGGNAASAAKGAWFAFNGDTYYVQSQHNGVSAPSFQNGVDFIVRLSGVVDLSMAGFNSDGNVLTLG